MAGMSIDAHAAGVEHGKLKHVPSTSDLLSAHVAVPPGIAAEARRAASDLGTALQVASAPGPSMHALAPAPSMHACCCCAAATHRLIASAASMAESLVATH